MATPFFFLEHIDLALKLGMRSDGARLHEHHAALDVFFLDPAKQETHVVAGHALVEQFAEHLHTGNGGFAGVSDADDFDFFANFDDAAFDTARCDSATSSDGEHVFDRH